jgi:hypothetical protein
MGSSTLAGRDAAGRAPEPAALLEAEVERHFQSFPRRGIAASQGLFTLPRWAATGANFSQIEE